MKLNMFKVPQRLKYAYMTEEQAKARGVDMAKWQQLVKIKDKIENIFYGAGGKPENFKKAILTGKGNKNHEVSGLGAVPDEGIDGMDENTPLPQLLGAEIYESENKGEGLGDLGDPVTGSSVAAATGVIGVIAELIKKIGNIFPKKDKASDDFQTTAQDDAAASDAANNASATDKAAVDNAPDTANTPATTDTSTDTSSDSSSDSSGDNKKKQSFWQKNKKWLSPALIVTAIAGAAYGGYKYIVSDDKEEKKKELSGLKSKKKKDQKKPVALL